MDTSYDDAKSANQFINVLAQVDGRIPVIRNALMYHCPIHVRDSKVVDERTPSSSTNSQTE